MFVCCWKSERLDRVCNVFVVGLILGTVGGCVRHGKKGLLLSVFRFQQKTSDRF